MARPKWRKRFSWIALGVLLIILAYELTLIPQPLPTWRHDLLSDVVHIERGLRFYELESGALPLVTGNASFIALLAGDNPRHIVFEVFDPARLNARGELIDPWGTPYQFALDSDHNIHISSAGPDREFNTKDDIRFVDPVTNAMQ